MTDKKSCSKCGIRKSLNEFYDHKYKNNTAVYKWTYCKDCAKKQHLEWKNKYPEKQKAANKNWRTNNQTKCNEQSKKWAENNPEKVKEITKKRRSTPAGRLNCNITSSISNSLRRNSNLRGWEKLVGYTLEDLKRHLELRFTKGMTWDAFVRGDIQVDHIIPKSKFNFETINDAEFKKCWSLSNIQPLWKKDNLKKYNKTVEFQGPIRPEGE